MSLPERRRRRPALSCTLCRKRKLRCDRESPCANCVRSKNENCVYENLAPHASHRRSDQPGRPVFRAQTFSESDATHGILGSSLCSQIPSHSASSITDRSTNPSVVAMSISGQESGSVKSPIANLKFPPSSMTPRSMQSPNSNSHSTPNIAETRNGFGGTFYLHRESGLPGGPQPIIRSISHKTRFFGQSHWMNGLAMLLGIISLLEPHMRAGTTRIIPGLQRSKNLARIVKAGRAPPWPTPLTSELPPRHIADDLVERYLRTSESVYRVLHIPTFRKDYEALWDSDSGYDAAFLVQLKLVLAIGATTYDEKFSLRATAVQWIYEAQAWLSEPVYKARFRIPVLQANLLLLIARETASLGEDLIWTSAGAVLRMGMYMGLHRDPIYLPKRTLFAEEMHRRLWNTILELTLQSSLASGGIPLISTDDFDTEPPRNFDDDQLADEQPIPKSADEFTQTSIAIAMRSIFPLRLKVIKFLNAINSHGSYDDTVQLDSQLRAEYKSLRHTLQNFSANGGSRPSPFASQMVEFVVFRYLMSLHVPFFNPKLHDSAYAFSRKVVVELSLKIWSAIYPSSSLVSSQTQGAALSFGSDDFAQFAVSSSGIPRTLGTNAAVFIAVELKTQLQEDDGLGPVPLRRDLLAVLDEAKSWCFRCIEAGETNIKGYLVMCVTAAGIDGLVRGLSEEEMPDCLVRVAEESIDACIPVLEALAGPSYQGDENVNGVNQMSLNTTPDSFDDWDLMISDMFYKLGSSDAMNWISDEGFT